MSDSHAGLCSRPIHALPDPGATGHGGSSRRRGAALIIAAYLAAVVVLPSVAQDLPSVDIDAATTQIEQFRLENDQMKRRSTNLETTNADLAVSVETWTEWRAAIEKVHGAITERADALYEVLTNVASRQVMERAQSVLERYSAIKVLLSRKDDDLASRIDNANDSIRRNAATIAEYAVRIVRNEENISLLQAAITKSTSAEEVLESYLQELEKALDDAESLLSGTD